MCSEYWNGANKTESRVWFFSQFGRVWTVEDMMVWIPNHDRNRLNLLVDLSWFILASGPDTRANRFLLPGHCSRDSVTAGLFVPLPRQTTNKFKEVFHIAQDCSQVLSAWLAYKFVDVYSQTHVHYNRWLTLHDISYGFSLHLLELINLWKALWWCCAAFSSLQLHSGLICIK